MQDIASTGAYVHNWQLLRQLMTRRLKEVVESYALEEAGYAHAVLYTGVSPAAPLTPALPSPITMPVDSARHEAKQAGSGGGPAGDGVSMDVDKPPPVPPVPEGGVVEAGRGEGDSSSSSAPLGSIGPSPSVHAPAVEGGAGAGGHTTPLRPPRPGSFALPSGLALDIEELEDQLGRFGSAAPWTLQRLCELLSTPRRFYAGSEKLTRALRTCLGRGVSGVLSAVAPSERLVPDPSTHLVYTQLGPLPKPPHDSSMTLRHSLSPGMGELIEEEAGGARQRRGGRAGFPSDSAEGGGRGGAVPGLGHRRPDVMTAGLLDIYGDLGEEGEEGGWEGGPHGGYGGGGVKAVSVPLLDHSDSDSSDSDEDVAGDETGRHMFQKLTAVKSRSEAGGKARSSGGSDLAASSRASSIVAGLLAGAMAGTGRARTDGAGAGPSAASVSSSVSSGGSKTGSSEGGGRKRFRSLGDDLDDLDDDIFPLGPSAAGAAAAEPTLAPRPQSGAADMEEDGVFGPRAGAGGASGLGRWSGGGPRSPFGVSLKAHENLLGRTGSAIQLPAVHAASSSASLSNPGGGGGDWLPVLAEEGEAGGGWSEVGPGGGGGEGAAQAIQVGDDHLFRRAASPDLDATPLPRMASPGLPRFMSRASPGQPRPSGEAARAGAAGEAGRSPLGRLGSALGGSSGSPYAPLGGLAGSQGPWEGSVTPSRPSILSPNLAPVPAVPVPSPLVAYGDSSSSSDDLSDDSDEVMGGAASKG
jgi:hypothetical protein